ncbi:recombinase family protein [bacterium]|nr:recombinase family protein [bacterium]
MDIFFFFFQVAKFEFFAYYLVVPNESDNQKRFVAIYARKSQEDGGPSIADQIESCTRFTEERDWVVVAVESDNGYSGGNFERPGWQRIMHLVRLGRINGIVAKHIDRFSRDSAGMTYLIEKDLAPAGVELHTAMMEMPDITSSTGRLLFQAMMMVNEWTRRVAQDKAYFKRTQSIQQKKWPGGGIPLGYALDDEKRLVPDITTAPTVIFIFNEWLATGSIAHISKALIKANLRSRKGNKITRGSIEHILKNPVYAGHTRDKNRDGDSLLFQDTHAPLIEPKRFAAAQLLFEEHRQPGPDTGEWIFRDIPVIEGASGSPLQPHYVPKTIKTTGERKIFRYMRVHNCFRHDHNDPRVEKVKVKSVSADRLEALVLDKLAELADSNSVADFERDAVVELRDALALAVEKLEQVSGEIEKQRALLAAIGEAEARGLKSTGEIALEITTCIEELEPFDYAWNELVSELQAAIGMYDCLSRTLGRIKRMTGTSLYNKRPLNRELRKTLERVIVWPDRVELVLMGAQSHIALPETFAACVPVSTKTKWLGT